MAEQLKMPSEVPIRLDKLSRLWKKNYKRWVRLVGQGGGPISVSGTADTYGLGERASGWETGQVEHELMTSTPGLSPEALLTKIVRALPGTDLNELVVPFSSRLVPMVMLPRPRIAAGPIVTIDLWAEGEDLPDGVLDGTMFGLIETSEGDVIFPLGYDVLGLPGFGYRFVLDVSKVYSIGGLAHDDVHLFFVGTRREGRRLGLFRWSKGGLAKASGGQLSSGAVIFVHGLWSEGLRFEQLASAAAADGREIFTYEYDFDQGINRGGAGLKSYLDCMKKGFVNIIAHSMGGLVARSAIANYGAHQKVRRLIMLGTPNRGAVRRQSLLSLAGMMIGLHRMLKVLVWRSQGIRDLTDPKFLKETFKEKNAGKTKYETIPGWGSLSVKEEGLPVLHRAAYGLWERALGLEVPNDGVVDDSSVKFRDDEAALFEQFASGKPSHWTKYSKIDQTFHSELLGEEGVIRHIVSCLKEDTAKK